MNSLQDIKLLKEARDLISTNSSTNRVTRATYNDVNRLIKQLHVEVQIFPEEYRIGILQAVRQTFYNYSRYMKIPGEEGKGSGDQSTRDRS